MKKIWLSLLPFLILSSCGSGQESIQVSEENTSSASISLNVSHSVDNPSVEVSIEMEESVSEEISLSIPSISESSSVSVSTSISKEDKLVTYKPGDHGIGDPYTSFIATDGSFILEDSKFQAEEGYIFSCWIKEGDESEVEYRVGDVLNSPTSVTFIAKWSVFDHPIVSYSIDYSAELYFPHTSEGTYSDGEFWIGESCTKLSYTVSGHVIRFMFAGEYYEFEFDENYQIIALVIATLTHTFVFGRPIEIPHVAPKITFLANGGEGSQPNLIVTEDDYDENVGKYRIRLPENTFVAPSGKKFDAWEIEGYKYQPGTSYFADPNSELIIQACWILDSEFVVEDLDNGRTLVSYNGTNKNLVIPDELGIQIISKNAFKNATFLETIDFSYTVLSLGAGCLNALPNLQYIILRSGVEVNGMGAYNANPLFGGTGKKLVVYVPDHLLSLDSDHTYMYGDDNWSTQSYEFRPLSSLEGEEVSDAYDKMSLSDFIGNYDGNFVVGSITYYGLRLETSTQFQREYVLKLEYDGTFSNTKTFPDYEENENHSWTFSTSNGTEKVTIASKQGKLYVIQYSKSSVDTYYDALFTLR